MDGVITLAHFPIAPLTGVESPDHAGCMDAVAAFTAPPITELAAADLPGFLGRRGLRVLHAHAGGPFGVLLKTLLHGRLGSDLRCARLDLGKLPEDAGGSALRSMVSLAGVQGDPPPPGYYLFKGKALVGYHPELEDDALASLVLAGARGVRVLFSLRDTDQAGRAALEGRPELGVLRFFEDAATGWTPKRAPAAGDRRSGSDRRGGARGGKSRRENDAFLAELDAACQLLGVTPVTPLRQVKAARNRLMRDNHPDRLAHFPQRQAEATRLTVQINEAFAVIRRSHGG